MVLHNPNNWHWVNKDASAWAKQWFEDNLTKIEAKEGDVSAKVTKIISMDGDVDVAQRKGKVITIFDVKLTLEYSGTYCHYLCRIQLHCTFEPRLPEPNDFFSSLFPPESRVPRVKKM